MIELGTLAKEISTEFNITDTDFNHNFVDFLEDNDWFSIVPEWKNDKLLISDTAAEIIRQRADLYFRNHELNTGEKVVLLYEMFAEKFPDTVNKLSLFFHKFEIPDTAVYSLLDFLLVYLHKDFRIMSDSEIEELMKHVFMELNKYNSDILTFFLSWLKDNYKTRYLNDYVMKKRNTNNIRNQAYDRDEYLELVYYLFNEEYIMDNSMYQKAAESKNFADTWLFLSIHFICSLRNTDIERIYHPRLTMSPIDVIDKVKNNCFEDKDARLTLYSITWHLNSLPLQPSKTSAHNGISSIKFCVPESVEVHMGTLFALCEAHRLIADIPDDTALIRRIADYDRITRYMGEDIGSLFLESNFRSRSANKSYLQSIYLFTDDILNSTDGEMNMKGYILAALARSHKGSYGEFAHTTSLYLKDANFSGLTPEFVAMELFERGVLSFIPSMLLKMITNNEFAKLPVNKQTELIQILDMTPYEIENVVKISNNSRKHAKNMLIHLIGQDAKTDKVLEILHAIGNGSAVSKQLECLCLMTAMHRNCTYPERGQCIGCQYEISTKSTVFLLISEYNRLRNLYQETDNDLSKKKYEIILKQEILPALDEILNCVNEQYGSEALKLLEDIIKENTI